MHCLFLRNLRHTSDTLWGFSGVYPPSLDLSTTSGPFANFLDISIRPSHSVVQLVGSHIHWCGYYETFLFDKRRDKKFSGIPLVRFPHIDSELTSRAQFSVVVSQFFRYTRVITNFRNFVCEYALLLRQLLALNYPESDLLKPVRRCFHSHPRLYGQTHNNSILQKVLRVMHDMRPMYDPNLKQCCFCLPSAEKVFDSLWPTRVVSTHSFRH